MLRRLAARRALRRRRPGYHSAFGGLWTDRLDAAELLAARRAAGQVDDVQAARLEAWMRDGFVVLEGAVPPEACAAVTAEVERAWRELDPRLLVELGGSYHDLAPELRARHFKLLDLYFWSAEVRRAALAPPVLDFLRLVFEREVLLFQSLSFEIGSGDPVHQDTANVVTESPLEFCAAWIALEDVRPGSGELCYYPGSHRLAEATFGPGVRNWNRRRDGKARRQEVLDGLHTRARARGLELQHFLPRRGDVLIWSADLAHGGAPIADPALTRRSLVCHYCPADVRPYYFSYRGRHRRLHPDPSGARHASKHYPR